MTPSNAVVILVDRITGSGLKVSHAAFEIVPVLLPGFTADRAAGGLTRRRVMVAAACAEAIG